MMPQFNNDRSHKMSLDKVATGITVFSIGLFKKIIIADSLALIANPIFTATNQGFVSSLDAFSGAIAYTLQIYFDFSGYSDMAVGISYMFGILLPFNFDSPYKSRNIVDFWKRWHITLSRFLRNYLYIPLGGNRCGAVRRYLNLLLTMLLGGLWHGAGWTFIMWGFLHGIYLTINHLWRDMIRSYPVLQRYSSSVIYSFFSLLLTQFSIVLAWIYFRADSIAAANRLIKSMFTFHHSVKNMIATSVSSVEILAMAIVYLACLSLPNIKFMFSSWDIGLLFYDNKSLSGTIAIKWGMTIPWAILTATLFAISLIFILIVGDGSQFLYFQF